MTIKKLHVISYRFKVRGPRTTELETSLQAATWPGSEAPSISGKRQTSGFKGLGFQNPSNPWECQYRTITCPKEEDAMRKDYCYTF
jgi:hypothetical protein